MIITGVFNLEAARNWAQSQTRRVTLDADTTGGVVTVNLPTIASVLALNAREVEIVVNDYGGNALANNITVVSDAGAGDLIEGAANAKINADDQTIIFTIGNEANWVLIA